jgi:hypothetical protein
MITATAMLEVDRYYSRARLEANPFAISTCADGDCQRVSSPTVREGWPLAKGQLIESQPSLTVGLLTRHLHRRKFSRKIYRVLNFAPSFFA